MTAARLLGIGREHEAVICACSEMYDTEISIKSLAFIFGVIGFVQALALGIYVSRSK